jgi:hypothetical protein
MKTRFIEQVNPEICEKITTLSFTTFKDIISTYKGQTDIDDLKTQYYQLKKYCEEQKENGYKISRTYSFGSGRSNGRLFVKPYGLQKINALFRGVLCENLYKDYDMINAHPVILKHILGTKGITSYQLNDYIEHREARLESLMNDLDCERWEAKLLYIGSMNSGFQKKKFNKKTIKDHAFKEFDKEMKRIQGLCEKTFESDYKEVKEFKTRSGKEYHSGHIINYLCMNLEATILNVVQDHFGTSRDVLIFDGFMAGGGIYPSIEDMNCLTAEYGIKWSIKPHDISIKQQIEEDEGEFSAVGKDLVEIGDELLAGPLKDKLIYCNGTLYYKDGNKWSANEKECKRTLRAMIMDCDLYVVSEKAGDYINVSKIPTHITNLTNMILNDRCPTDNEFVDKVWDNSIGKLCFENGWYDFEKRQFNDSYDGIDTFIIAPRPLSMERNAEARKEINDRLIKPIFTLLEDREDLEERTQMKDCILHRLARAMGGYVVDKRWILMTSGRNSGKGVIGGALESAFGREYVKTADNKQFKFKDSSQDSAKANSFLYDFQFSRLMLCSEAATSNGKGSSPTDGVKIKMTLSGGDYIETRKNYMDEQRIRLQASLLFFANDFPKCEPDDAMDSEFCLKFEMKSKFVDAKDLDKQKFITQYFVKDDTIKTQFLKDPVIMNEFILMLLDAFNNPVSPPQSLIDEGECLQEATDEDKLINLFEMSKNSFVDYSALKMLLNLHDISMTQQRATRILTDHFGIKRENWGCKVGGVRGIKGLRHKIEVNDGELEEED